MKKIAIIVLLALTLTSCVNNEKKEIEKEVNTDKKTTETKTEIKADNNIVNKTDTITVTYTGSTADWKIFDASSKHPGQDLSFEVWAGKMIKGFDQGVIWMKLGETKIIKIPAKDAYGESNELLLKPEDFIALESIWLKKSDLTVWVHKIEKTGWEIEILRIEWDKIYAKHPSPLAWKDLIFEITIDKIVPFVKKEVVSIWDNISVSYTGSTTDWKIFDATSKHWGVPLEFKAWARQMIKWFDAWVIGMKLGETKTINIPAKDAYGETGTHKLSWKDLIFEVKIESIR